MAKIEKKTTGSGGFAATMDTVNAQNHYLLSLFTKAPSKEIIEEFEQVDKTRLSDMKL